MSYIYNHEHADTLSMEGTFGIKNYCSMLLGFKSCNAITKEL